ncbi:unnamed protein product [Porites lobata]|uniref:THAP-type domain-containing protein n=1 Tax=Porites lobata TaxID=104759 RepID=A0ABN8R0S9_9CNID|nr:unnamed protein product [Porites lobata]
MANDHCSVNCCTNDKRNESGKDLSFFNFPSNETQRSQWIAAIKRDEGPHFEDVELKPVTEQVTVQEASAGAEPMEEMNAELENENIQPAELSAEEQIEILKAKIKDLEEEVEDLKGSRFGAENISKDPELLSFYTGFVSKERFDSFYSWVEPYAKTMIKWSQIQRQRGKENYKRRRSCGNLALSLYDQFFFLFMIRLRLGLLETDLGVRFNISKSSVLNSEFYSAYKSHTTLKCLVGIAPHGAVTFISSLYQGSISDKEITRRSGILSLIQEGDEVMADKGFLIQDLLEPKKATLTIPPFLSKTRSMQFTSKEVTETQQIARLRIHVERAIRRIKEYQIFDKVLPLSLAGSVNQIWTVCCLLTNFRGPLY